MRQDATALFASYPEAIAGRGAQSDQPGTPLREYNKKRENATQAHLFIGNKCTQDPN